MKVYIVTAYRWGDRETHSYVVGVFDDKELSILAAKTEKEWRGGKYDCEVVSMKLNESRENNNYVVEYKIEEYFKNEKL